MRRRVFRVWLVVVGLALAANAAFAGAVWAQDAPTPPASSAGARVGDLEIAFERAEKHPTLEVPGFPVTTPAGEYLLVWLTLTNAGVDAIEYDVCPPDGAVCVNPGWFAAVDVQGLAYPVDIIATSILEQAEEVLPGGADLPPGVSARIVLAFDVPAGVAAWSLASTDQAPTPFTLPLTTSTPPVTPEVTAIAAGMNEVVAIGDLELVATRAEVRSAIELVSFPEPFIPRGEYVVVRLTLTNTGAGPMEYDICPPDGPVCVNQTWFQLVDAQGRAYPVEPTAWAALSMTEDLLPFGAALDPGFPEAIVLVFDVPPGVADWWLASTDQAPVPFAIRLALSLAPGSIRVMGGAPGDGATAAAGATVELILDTSGSMLQELEGRRRIDVAKAVLTDLVATTVPAGTPLALRVFGDAPGSCETRLAVPVGPLDSAEATAVIGQLQAVDEVQTPIAAALALVADDLRGVEGPKIVVLVTDGEETCGGDPRAAIRDLVAQGIDVQVNVVGFAVADEALRSQFEEWAHLGNGRYFDAAGAAELGAALARAVQPPFRVLTLDGGVVATGVVDGDPVEVPAGRYRVEVQTVPPRVFEVVVVASGQRIELVLAERR